MTFLQSYFPQLPHIMVLVNGYDFYLTPGGCAFQHGFYRLLHSVKLFQREDWFVAVRYVVLGQAVICLPNIKTGRKQG